MAKKIISRLANAKNRTLLLTLGVIVVLAVFYAVSQVRKTGDDPISKEGSVSANVPRIRSVPGGVTSPKYVELQQTENEQKADQALRSRTASIPTIIGTIQEDTTAPNFKIGEVNSDLPNTFGTPELSQIQIGEAQSGAFISSGPFQAQKAAADRQKEIEQRRQEQVARVENLRKEQEERQKRVVEERQQRDAQKEYTAEVNQLKNNMRQYAQIAYKNWSTFTPQTYRTGRWANEPYQTVQERYEQKKGDKPDSPRPTSTNDTTNSNTQNTTQNPLGPRTPSGQKREIIKAGTILFGVIDTAINTDEPTPILASIVHGKYKGGKLIGTISHQGTQEKATLNFQTMTLPSVENSFSVNIIAIDPDTARTALASDVDKHYLLRYGSLFASSFMQGYANAISEQGTRTTTSSLTGSTTQTKPELSGSEEFFTALGEVGKRWGQAVAPLFNTPYTVTIKQGTGLGLLFTSDTTIPIKEE